MSSKVENALRDLMDAPEIEFNESNLASHGLPSGQTACFRYDESAGVLLVSIGIGGLASGHGELTPFLAMTANHAGLLTAGGALGIDPDTHEVFLSRAFHLNPDSAEHRDSLSGLPVFSFSAAALQEWLSAANSLHYNPKIQRVSSSRFSNRDLATAASETHAKQAAESEPEIDSDSQAKLQREIDQALLALNLAPQAFDEDLAIYLHQDDLAVQIRYDIEMQELVLIGVLRDTHFDEAMEKSRDWLALNLHVAKTGNCSLGIVADKPLRLTLTHAVALEALLPDTQRLANIIGGFWKNCLAVREEITDSSTSEAFSVPPNVSQFV